MLWLVTEEKDVSQFSGLKIRPNCFLHFLHVDVICNTWFSELAYIFEMSAFYCISDFYDRIIGQ